MKVNKLNVRIWGTVNTRERRKVAKDTANEASLYMTSVIQMLNWYYLEFYIVVGRSYRQLPAK